MSETGACSAVRAFAESHKFSGLTLGRWRRLEPADQATLLRLAERLRLGENHFRDFLDWSEEIAARDRCSITEVWNRAPLATALARDLGRNQLIAVVKATLRRIRFPQLTAAESRMAELIKELRLPPGVRLRLPDDLEGTELRVEMAAESASMLHAQLAALRRVFDRPELEEIFRLLQEAT